MAESQSRTKRLCEQLIRCFSSNSGNFKLTLSSSLKALLSTLCRSIKFIWSRSYSASRFYLIWERLRRSIARDLDRSLPLLSKWKACPQQTRTQSPLIYSRKILAKEYGKAI